MSINPGQDWPSVVPGRVTVMVPLYNHAAYIQTALDSLLAQTDADLEILVIDDGSTDGGDQRVEAHYAAHGVRLIRQPRNGCGIVRALNTAVRLGRGEFFCWLSSDDWFLPEKIARQREAYDLYFGQTPGVLYGMAGYVTQQLEYALKQARLNPAEIQAQFQREGQVYWHEFAEDPPIAEQLFYFFLFNYINGITVFLPRYLFQLHGCFSPSFPLVQDYEFWFRLALAGVPFRIFPEVLSVSRMHIGNLGRYQRDIPAENQLLLRMNSERVRPEQLAAVMDKEGFAPDQFELFLARIMQARAVEDYELIWLERARQRAALPPDWEARYQQLRAYFGACTVLRSPGAEGVTFVLYLSPEAWGSSRWQACLTHFLQAFGAEEPVRLQIWAPRARLQAEAFALELENRMLSILTFLEREADCEVELLLEASLAEILGTADAILPVASADPEESRLIYHAYHQGIPILYETEPEHLRALCAQRV